MEIRLSTEPTQAWLGRMFREQLPFATSVALNRTAKAVQEAERAALREHFTIRRPWVTQGIVIPRFSDKRDNPMQVSVTIDAKRQFLAKFQAGGVKTGSPIEPIAIPSAAIRPSFAAIPPLALYPKNLGLVARRGVKGFVVPAKLRRYYEGKTIQLKGKQRTFVLDANTMFGVRVTGIYQRFGPGRADIRLLWTYKSQIPIPARLQFDAIALATIQQVWPGLFQQAFEQAVRTAR